MQARHPSGPQLTSTLGSETMKILTIILVIVVIVATGFWWLWGGNFKDSVNVSLHATKTTEVRGSSVSLAVDDILLFKTPEKHTGAIRFERMTPDSGADYSSWFIPASSNDRSFRNIHPQKGHVFEKYWRTRTGINSYHVIDIGGNYTIECGPVKLNWSASTWVYFPPGYEIAILNNTKIDDIVLSDPTIKWNFLSYN